MCVNFFYLSLHFFSFCANFCFDFIFDAEKIRFKQILRVIGEEAGVGHDSFGDEITKATHLDQEDLDHDYHTGTVLPMDKSLDAEQMNLEQLIRVAQSEPLGASAPTLVDGVGIGGSRPDGFQIDGHYLPDNVDISRSAVHTG